MDNDFINQRMKQFLGYFRNVSICLYQFGKFLSVTTLFGETIQQGLKLIITKRSL